MRSSGFRLVILVAILTSGIASSVWALGHHSDTIETVYVMPGSVSGPVETSYVVSTSWVEPTAYAVPTYYTTSYWMDPVVLAQPTYATATYVRRGLLGRRWLVERPVLASYTLATPTALYAPTVARTTVALADPGLVRSSYLTATDYCICPEGAPATRAATPGTGTSTAPRVSGRTRSTQNEPSDLSAVDSDVPAAPSGPAAGAANARQTIPQTLPMEDFPANAAADNTPTPPNPQPVPSARNTTGTAGGARATSPTNAVTPGAGAAAAGSAPGTTGQGPGGTAGGGNAGRVNPNAANTNTGGTPANTNTGGTPANTNTGGTPANTGAGRTGNSQAPGAGIDSEPASLPPPSAPADGPPPLSGTGEVRRESQRPTYGSSVSRPRTTNVLLGTVLSGTLGEPEEGVRIGVRSATGGTTKAATTDAFGRFAVRLADGDWSVDVTMPSGRVYVVSRLLVRNGVITDTQGRRVPSLEITR